MGVSLSLDRSGGDKEKYKQTALDILSEPASLLVVFARACRWCLVALLVQLFAGRVFYDPSSRYRSSWISGYPFQIYGIAVALFLAVRLWVSFERSWQFRLRLKELTSKLLEYALVGLAVEEHSRESGCPKCNRPATLHQWLRQQNFRMAFLHYISLLHAMAITSLCGSRKPRFQKQAWEVLNVQKNPEAGALCDCSRPPKPQPASPEIAPIHMPHNTYAYAHVHPAPDHQSLSQGSMHEAALRSLQPHDDVTRAPSGMISTGEPETPKRAARVRYDDIDSTQVTTTGMQQSSANHANSAPITSIDAVPTHEGAIASTTPVSRPMNEAFVDLGDTPPPNTHAPMHEAQDKPAERPPVELHPVASVQQPGSRSRSGSPRQFGEIQPDPIAALPEKRSSLKVTHSGQATVAPPDDAAYAGSNYEVSARQVEAAELQQVADDRAPQVDQTSSVGHTAGMVVGPADATLSAEPAVLAAQALFVHTNSTGESNHHRGHRQEEQYSADSTSEIIHTLPHPDGQVYDREYEKSEESEDLPCDCAYECASTTQAQGDLPGLKVLQWTTRSAQPQCVQGDYYPAASQGLRDAVPWTSSAATHPPCVRQVSSSRSRTFTPMSASVQSTCFRAPAQGGYYDDDGGYYDNDDSVSGEGSDVSQGSIHGAQYTSQRGVYERVSDDRLEKAPETLSAVGCGVFPDAREPHDAAVVAETNAGIMKAYVQDTSSQGDTPESTIPVRALNAFHFEGRPMRSRKSPAHNPFMKVVHGLFGTGTRPTSRARYAQHYIYSQPQRRFPIVESRSSSLADQRSDEALVWHDNPIAARLYAFTEAARSSHILDEVSVPLPVFESKSARQKRSPYRKLSAAAKKFQSAPLDDEDAQRAQQQQHRGSPESGSQHTFTNASQDSSFTIASPIQPPQLSFFTLGAYSGAEQRHAPYLPVILGVSTSEQEYLGLNKTSPTSSEDLYRYRSYGYRPASDTVTPSVTSSVTHEERMHAVHAWLVRHVSGDEFVEAGEDLEQSNMQPLLSDAWAAYNACKEAASNSTTSTWLLSTAILLAFFTVVLPFISVSRIGQTYMSAFISFLVVLGFAVMFEFATYLDAFGVLVPASAKVAQTGMNDILVSYAKGPAPGRGGPCPHQLRIKGAHQATREPRSGEALPGRHSSNLSLSGEAKCFNLQPPPRTTAPQDTSNYLHRQSHFPTTTATPPAQPTAQAHSRQPTQATSTTATTSPLSFRNGIAVQPTSDDRTVASAPPNPMLQTASHPSPATTVAAATTGPPSQAHFITSQPAANPPTQAPQEHHTPGGSPTRASSQFYSPLPPQHAAATTTTAYLNDDAATQQTGDNSRSRSRRKLQSQQSDRNSQSPSWSADSHSPSWSPDQSPVRGVTNTLPRPAYNSSNTTQQHSLASAPSASHGSLQPSEKSTSPVYAAHSRSEPSTHMMHVRPVPGLQASGGPIPRPRDHVPLSTHRNALTPPRSSSPAPMPTAVVSMADANRAALQSGTPSHSGGGLQRKTVKRSDVERRGELKSDLRPQAAVAPVDVDSSEGAPVSLREKYSTGTPTKPRRYNKRGSAGDARQKEPSEAAEGEDGARSPKTPLWKPVNNSAFAASDGSLPAAQVATSTPPHQPDVAVLHSMDERRASKAIPHTHGFPDSRDIYNMPLQSQPYTTTTKVGQTVPANGSSATRSAGIVHGTDVVEKWVSNSPMYEPYASATTVIAPQSATDTGPHRTPSSMLKQTSNTDTAQHAQDAGAPTPGTAHQGGATLTRIRTTSPPRETKIVSTKQGPARVPVKKTTAAKKSKHADTAAVPPSSLAAPTVGGSSAAVAPTSSGLQATVATQSVPTLPAASDSTIVDSSAMQHPTVSSDPNYEASGVSAAAIEEGWVLRPSPPVATAPRPRQPPAHMQPVAQTYQHYQPHPQTQPRQLKQFQQQGWRLPVPVSFPTAQTETATVPQSPPTYAPPPVTGPYDHHPPQSAPTKTESATPSPLNSQYAEHHRRRSDHAQETPLAPQDPSMEVSSTGVSASHRDSRVSGGGQYKIVSTRQGPVRVPRKRKS